MRRMTPALIVCLFASGILWSVARTGESAAQEERSQERFEVTALDGGAVLLDRSSGLSWYLKTNARTESGKEWTLITRQAPKAENSIEAAISREAIKDLDREQLKTALTEAQIQHRMLQEQYSSKHPRVIQAQKRIELLKKMSENR